MTDKKILDLRYNEMWKTWNDTVYENDDCSAALSTQDLVLSWKRLSVTVEKKIPAFFGPSKITYKRILDNINGKVERGSLLGIIGPSGSGKTTLMATISHRTKGNFQGELLLNGRSVSESVMIQISGFVAQEDESFVQLTVLEQLKLMARLKMDRRSTNEDIADRINDLAAHLGLNRILNTRLHYLSGGERKKVALAVQLINDPPVLFCDEITTGLDSYSAAHVINTLRRVAKSGKIVMCTIHQPASGLFDQFKEVILLTNGRLAYHGTVSLMNDMLNRYSYICPATYNKADHILSILSSNSVMDRSNVNDMCERSSQLVDIEYNRVFCNKNTQSVYGHHLQSIKKVNWIVEVSILLSRSVTCFVRNYKENILDLGALMFLGIIIACPYANLQFDTYSVQNWQGFWLCLVINATFQLSFSTLAVHQINFSVVHREVSNKMYSLSAYYVSESILLIIWLLIKVVLLCLLVFWIVGVQWIYTQLLALVVVSFAAFSYGSLLSACFGRIEEAVFFSSVYEYLALPFSGAYLSFSSLPKVLYALRYLSLFFLGCESVSSLFWYNIKSLPCVDVDSCLDSGEAVLNKYGFKSKHIYTDLTVLLVFSFSASVLGYVGLLRRTKKRPAY